VSAERVSQPTDAVERYVAQFEAFAGNGAADAPAWLRELRAGAMARFAALGFPTTRQEEWRFTSVAPLVEGAFAPAPSAGRPGPVFAGGGPLRMVFVNGRYAAQQSSLAGLPPGVRVGNLAALLAGAGGAGAFVERHLGRAATLADNPFAALNTAFVSDGAVVHLTRGAVLAEPLHLIFASAPGGKPTVSHPRLLVVADEQARATLIEHFVAWEDTPYWTNAVTEVVVGDGATVEIVRVQEDSRQAYHVASTHTRQGRGSTLALHPLVLGAALARHDITNVLDGPGGELLLNGLYLLGGRQHADHHTVIDHAQPDCQSHEYFNGVLDGEARGVFNGRIVVRPGAQRTDSKQTNHNLVLSEQARADSQPQLEIYADDVKCTHGATLGPLDPKEVFYLQSRGLAPAEARALLTYGFGAEILGRLRFAPLRETLEGLVRERLAAGHVGGLPGAPRADL
jgi:Fe-S cluster assembly protein SufD